MRRTLYILMSLVIFGCSEKSPNKFQTKSTYQNLECLHELLNNIQNDTIFQAELVQIRNKKTMGFSPIKTKQNYRLIDVKEFENKLPKSWKQNCFQQIKQERDLRGIRFVSKDTIIIEIDQFERKTLSERYRKGDSYEIHRILTISNLEENSFRYQSEKTIFKETLKNGLTYEITQRVQ